MNKWFNISSVEATHIIVSVATISLAFSLFKNDNLFSFEYFILILLSVGSAFILHELGHKYAALHFGVHAEYRAWTTGLFLAVAMAFLTRGSFVFAAPGAVYIFGRVTNEQNGKIALAGPAMNFLLALFFLALYFGGAASEFAALGAYINLLLGGFNMIPIHPFDGAKIAAWNQGVWVAGFAAFFLGFLLLF
ncbi:hypothetical protein COX85_01520 [Candidatus Micrarchaeota archaeon CG_4_10_14_0_2_um_filter_55_9]|nr:MAG: hypothetical protein COX85_01520 [Candidatus Micrarchaeota archaeon CG_4_10_14_0_2_um_filter_55_9]